MLDLLELFGLKGFTSSSEHPLQEPVNMDNLQTGAELVDTANMANSVVEGPAAPAATSTPMEVHTWERNPDEQPHPFDRVAPEVTTTPTAPGVILEGSSSSVTPSPEVSVNQASNLPSMETTAAPVAVEPTTVEPAPVAEPVAAPSEPINNQTIEPVVPTPEPTAPIEPNVPTPTPELNATPEPLTPVHPENFVSGGMGPNYTTDSTPKAASTVEPIQTIEPTTAAPEPLPETVVPVTSEPLTSASVNEQPAVTGTMPSEQASTTTSSATDATNDGLGMSFNQVREEYR